MSTVRFSHYCLEDGDEYFGDVIAELRSFRIVSTTTTGSSFASENPSFATTTSSSSSSMNGSFFPNTSSNMNMSVSSLASPLMNASCTTTKQGDNNQQQQLPPSHHQAFLQMTHRHYTELRVTAPPSSQSTNNNSTTRIEYIPSVIRGKLRFGSKGLFFDADDTAIPVMGFKSQTILNSWEQARSLSTENHNTWSTPVLPLSSLVSSSSSSLLLSKEAAIELSRSSTAEYLNQTIILPFSGTVTGQRRFGLPHPHLLDSTSFSAPNTFLCFILPFASTTQSFNDYLNRTNMLILARHATVEITKRQLKLLMIQKARESTNGFKFSFLEDPDGEDILRETCCHRIQPLIRERGRAVISSLNIYFQPTFPIATAAAASSSSSTSGGTTTSGGGGGDAAASLTKIPLRTVTQVERRWFDCTETALEIFFEERQKQISSIFLHFESVEDRELFSAALRKHPVVKPILRAASVPFVQELWHQGKITNFDYLMFLNSFAGRSKQDLSQYPIIPWIISNYTSNIFDFDDPSNYRDLSKPIGALEPKRLEMFKRRAQDLREMGQEPFLYGTHYSNSAYVIYFLLRSTPQLMLVLQSGRWDKPQRLFDSVPEVWKSVLENPTDVKELIPEFFEANDGCAGGGDFLDLKQTLSGRSQLSLTDTELESLFDFGKTDDGEPVRFAVQLPPWANGDVYTFIKINKMAIESEIVSASIHHWIDLIFGYKQKGDEAWKANNVFHPSCYEDQDSSSSPSSNQQSSNKKGPSPDELDHLRAHRQMFGRVPRQIFTQPHPLRRCLERKLYKRATSQSGNNLDEMNDDNSERLEDVKPLASLRDALLQLSQQDLNNILTTTTSPSKLSNQQQQQQQQSSFGSKPSSSATPSFAGPSSPPPHNNNNNNQNKNNMMRNGEEDEKSSPPDDGRQQHFEEVTARAVELAEQLERQISESHNTSLTGKSHHHHHEKETPIVENSADLFANFATPAPKDMLFSSKKHKNRDVDDDDDDDDDDDENENANDDDDEEDQRNTHHYSSSPPPSSSIFTSTPSETSPTMIQCLPRLPPGSTLPPDVMHKFGSGKVGFVTAATVKTSATGSATTCLLVLLSNDGTEVGVLPVTSRGFEEMKVCSLPERCISAVTWESPPEIQEQNGTNIHNNNIINATSSSSWIILVSYTGNILVFSPFNCKVYARIPDSGDVSDVITCVSFWKSGSLLFCGRDNGSTACWSINENRSVSSPTTTTIATNESESSSSATTTTVSSNPPMVSKTALNINFETGRALVASCRDGNSQQQQQQQSNNSQLVFASDDGEILFAKHSQKASSIPFVASMVNPKTFIKPFAGMSHEIDIKSILSVWPVHTERAHKVCKMESIAENFSEDEIVEEDCIIVFGVLTSDGKIHFVGSRDDSDESDLLEHLDSIDLQQQQQQQQQTQLASPSSSSSSSSSKPVVAHSILTVNSSFTTRPSTNKNSCLHFITVLTNGGRTLSLLDSDSGKAVLPNLLANSASASTGPYSILTTSWPFVIAMDTQNGQICVWELLMF